MRLEIEWSTGPNMTGYYTGTETVELDDGDDEQKAIENALKTAADRLCWHGKLKVKEVKRIG
ncbi:MAG: hypothetical protein ABW104_18045 [Candidatus Thiodiazotropha sp. 6PLUC2]|nr:hypothetical protein [Candidatus Thiodiazotropha lotti]MCW4218803.1 hypothetical protein [Candidatus Thiodiazotropha lotti]